MSTKTLIPCPTCEGKKTLDIKAQVIGKLEPEPMVTIDCVTCNGTGKITEQAKQELDAWDAMWCKCDDPNDAEHVVYHSDRTCGDCYKHHYHHTPGCGKIVQVG